MNTPRDYSGEEKRLLAESRLYENMRLGQDYDVARVVGEFDLPVSVASKVFFNVSSRVGDERAKERKLAKKKGSC